ncbi:hypothetical protein K9U40_13505 [Xanthobacter autotrophicus]|uniref:hypothetical protein n=1 Tax=Xanthobacter TaxID=279 RepID=UPI0024AB134E|nr:hypothetical protein [Xanthobacter autotrophicus]MDI4665335.1 hypothetical protein [Xanthobacter autotrophicus]
MASFLYSMRRGAFVAAAVAAIFGPVAAGRAQPAAPAEDCDTAAWPLAADRARLAASRPKDVRPGEALALPLEGAVALHLVAQAGANLPLAPSKGDARSFAGVVAVQVPGSERLWQITVSGPSWIDVVVDGRPLEPVAFTGLHACPGVRKSLRFKIPPGLVQLQASGAEAPLLNLLVTQVE